MEIKRTFSFNILYIVESLPDNEIQTGKRLYDDIKLFRHKADFLHFEYVQIYSKRDIEEFLALARDIVIGYKINPFIHFEIHGSKEGLVLSSGELLTWNNLADLLREVNIATKNQLFISLASCYGAYIYSAIHPLQPTPVLGFIGTWVEIDAGDLMKDFSSFFQHIFSADLSKKADFNSAVNCLNGERSFHLYNFQPAELIFERVNKIHLKMMYDPQQLEDRIQIFIKESLQDPEIRKTNSRKVLRSIYMDRMNNLDEIVGNMRAIFLMEKD